MKKIVASILFFLCSSTLFAGKTFITIENRTDRTISADKRLDFNSTPFPEDGTIEPGGKRVVEYEWDEKSPINNLPDLRISSGGVMMLDTQTICRIFLHKLPGRKDLPVYLWRENVVNLINSKCTPKEFQLYNPNFYITVSPT